MTDVYVAELPDAVNVEVKLLYLNGRHIYNECIGDYQENKKIS